MHFTIEGEKSEVTVELPYIYYLGYNVYVNGQKVEYQESDNGFIMINITLDGTKTIELNYTGTKLEKITFVISIVSSLGFIAYIIYCRKKRSIFTKRLSNF